MSLSLARGTLQPVVWLTIPCRALSLTHSNNSSLRNPHHAHHLSSNRPASTTSFVLPKPATQTQWPLNTPRSTPPASSVALIYPPPEAQAQSHLPANSTRTTTASSTPKSTSSQTTSPKPSSRRRDARAASWTVSDVLRRTRARMPAGLLLAKGFRATLMGARWRSLRRLRSLSVRRRLLSNRLRTSGFLGWGRCSGDRVR
jgi:hypothetical protein